MVNIYIEQAHFQEFGVPESQTVWGITAVGQASAQALWGRGGECALSKED